MSTQPSRPMSTVPVVSASCCGAPAPTPLERERGERSGPGATATYAVRPAAAADLEHVRTLLVAAGLPASDVDGHFGERYAVAMSDAGEVVGAEGIEVYGRFGLLRSAVVAESWRGRGVGEALTRNRLAWAAEHGLDALYLLTTTAADYFLKFGFARVDRMEVPAEVLASSEFSSLCPSSATVMWLGLAIGAETGSAAAAEHDACCGDPTPIAETGACCGAPSPACGCQKSQNEASDAETQGAGETRLPVAVIGAGPVGLAAAVQLVARGETPLILEAGDAVGASIRQWAHVRLFSPWKYVVDPTARRMLEATGWAMPDEDHLPTGGELLSRLVEPLAALPQIAPHVRLGHRVLAVTRRGYDKVKTMGRDEAPFELVVLTPEWRTERLLARAVIDASGTWHSPNPMGAGGVTAEGEREAAEQVLYGIPDVFGRDRARYAGKRTLVVGSGHSAFNALLDLAGLKQEVPNTEIVWVIRRTDVGLMFGGGRKDALQARGALGERLRRLVETGTVRLELGVRIARVAKEGGALIVESETGTRLGPVDEIIVTTGFRPDLSLTRELRLRLDPWLEAPEQLAPLVDPNLHSCGTVYPHGAAELAHPEKDYYVVGMKSYGRAPTFLLLTGYEQVRSVVCALVGDEEGARNVELVLPETGVCQTDLGGSSCCTIAAEVPTTGASCSSSRTSCGVAAEPAATEVEPALVGAPSACGCSARAEAVTLERTVRETAGATLVATGACCR